MAEVLKPQPSTVLRVERAESVLLARGLRLRLSGQLCDEFCGVEYLAHDFEHAARVNGDCAVDRLVVDEVSDERLDVSVEDESDQLALTVHGRRAGVSADGGVGREEVEGCLWAERRFRVTPRR